MEKNDISNDKEIKEKIDSVNNLNIPNENKYSLKNANDDNNIEYNISNIDDNIINNQNNKNDSSIINTRIKKQEINYAFIIKNISDNILNKNKEYFFEDEYKINLLLMSSLDDISIKSICLYLNYIFNEKKNNYSLLNYILYKMNQYNEKNKNIYIKLFVYILKSYAEILLKRNKYFYPYYFLQKAKNLLSTKDDCRKELEEINLLFTTILEGSSRHIKSKYDLFTDKQIMNEKKLNSINNVLREILLQNNSNKGNNNNIKVDENINNKNSINDDNEELGTYSFMINKTWIDKTKIFLDYYIISSREMMLDELKTVFNEEYVLYSFFKESKDKNDMGILYPGPIDNYNLLKYRDAWEDDVNEDENYFLKDNLEIYKDYYLTSQRNWNILNEIFDSTNEIKRNENTEFIEIKALILEERLRKKVNKHLLRRRYIQIRKKSNIKKLKEKIFRCINNELKKKGAYFADEYLDDEDEYEQIKKKINNCSINFYLLNKENKNILIEICSAFTKNILIYNSIFLKEIKLKEEEPINSLFNFYDKKKHILIIEITENNKDNFLQVIKPILYDEKNENYNTYQCTICDTEININKRYICRKCNISFFCSETCSSILGEHKQLDKALNILLKSDFNFEQMKKKNIYYENISSKGLVGLFNLGNTCYMNSVIQCLSNTSDFAKYFLMDFYKNEQNLIRFDPQGDLVEEFAKLLRNLWFENEQVISPQKFRRAFCRINKQFRGNLEQDAQEFLAFLFSSLHEQLNRVTKKTKYEEIEEKKENETNLQASERYLNIEKKKNDSIINDLFNGQFISTTTCNICGKENTFFEQFNILSLPIPKNHCLISIKYFTEKDLKTFPFSINQYTTFANLKDKALMYYKKKIIDKILKNSDGDFNEILENDNSKIIYNYNNKIIPKYILYKYIDIIILDKYKNILYNKVFYDEDKILSIVDKSDYEIVLYEKENISKDFLNIYVSANYYSSNRFNIFKKFSVYTYSYPVLLNFKSLILMEKLDRILKNKFKNILNLSNINPEEYSGNPIHILILHLKKSAPCYFCQKTAEESPFCLLENLFGKNLKISLLENEFNDMPIFLAADSKYYEVQRKCFMNNILFFNPDKEETNPNEHINIYDCLEKFREEESLEKDNKYFCEKCKKQQNARKKIQIFNSPLYLIIQLKRFKYSNSLMAKFFDRTKIETFVEIPEFLDLKEYVLGPENNNSIMYELYGNILHDENHHYVAVCKNEDRWVLFNDDSLYRVGFPQHRNSYLLFYKKKS